MADSATGSSSRDCTGCGRSSTQPSGERDRCPGRIVVVTHLLESLAEVGCPNLCPVVADGEHPRLGGERGEFRPGEPVGLGGSLLHVDAVVDVHLAGVDVEDLSAGVPAGLWHLDEAVEAAGAEDGAVEHVEAVGGGDDADLAAVLEPVHLGEQLHHGALDLGVTGGFRLGAFGRDGVDLVDKDDRGFVLPGEFEQVTNEFRPLADELVNEFGAGHLDEGGVGLVCNGPGEHRLAGSRRPVQQNPRRRVDTDRLEHLGATKRHLDGLTDLLDLLSDAADVAVGHLGAAVDLHHPCPDVGFVVERLDDRQGVVHSHTGVWLQTLAHLVCYLCQRLLVVSVLLYDDAVVGQLLDRRDEQRRLLELLVLVGQPLQLLLVLVVLGVRVQQFVPHVLVLPLEHLESLL